MHVAAESNGAVYTGRRLKVVDNTIEVSMPEFVEGRLLPVSCKDVRKRSGLDPASPLEKAEFYSATGSLHWLSSQYRLDQCFDVNQYRKVQHEATVDHVKELNKSIKDTSTSYTHRTHFTVKTE